MKILIATALVFLLGIAQAALAQPTLDRVEQQLRVQVPPLGADAEDPNAPAQEPGYLGLVADDSKDQGRGIRLLNVIPDGPAAKGGLRVNDLITSVNGQQIGRMDDMARVLSKLPAGTKLDFQVTRADGDRQLQVTLSQRPPEGQRPFKQFGPIPKQAEGEPTPAEVAPPNRGVLPAPTSGRARLGVRTLPVTEDARRQFNLQSAAGALVSAVTPNSPADKAGIPAGAIITSLDNKKIIVPDDLSAIIRQAGPGRRLEIAYLSRGQEVRGQVTLDSAAAPSALTKPSLAGSRVPSLSPAPSGDASADARIEALEARLQTLEARLSRLETLLERQAQP